MTCFVCATICGGYCLQRKSMKEPMDLRGKHGIGMINDKIKDYIVMNGVSYFFPVTFRLFFVKLCIRISDQKMVASLSIKNL